MGEGTARGIWESQSRAERVFGRVNEAADWAWSGWEEEGKERRQKTVSCSKFTVGRR